MISTTKHILIPTDFSACSRMAMMYAGRIAEKTGAKITLLNVIEPPFNFPTNVEGVIDYLKENAEQHMERMEDEFNKKFDGKNIKIKHQLRIGKPVSQIIEAIGDSKVDMVVMGSGTEESKRQLFFGSVSSDIMLSSPVPVLAVPEKAKDLKFENFLFTTNFRPGDFKNLNETANFAKLFGSSIHLLHVAKEKNLETEIKFRGIKDLAKEEKLLNKLNFELLIDDDVIQTMSKFIDSKDISLLVLNRYKKSVLESMLDENHTKKMRIYSKVPLLVLVGEK
ncbi:MAG: universal stress protein [Balneolaceae bacterium]|nr:universal stress protein [Balneolaceae bacterium]